MPGIWPQSRGRNPKEPQLTSSLLFPLNRWIFFFDQSRVQGREIRVRSQIRSLRRVSLHLHLIFQLARSEPPFSFLLQRKKDAKMGLIPTKRIDNKVAYPRISPS